MAEIGLLLIKMLDITALALKQRLKNGQVVGLQRGNQGSRPVFWVDVIKISVLFDQCIDDLEVGVLNRNLNKGIAALLVCDCEIFGLDQLQALIRVIPHEFLEHTII